METEFRLYIESVIYRESKPFAVKITILPFPSKKEADSAFFKLFTAVGYGTRNVIKLYGDEE